VKALLRNHADINKCNNWNTSPLITASNHGHIDVVEYLLSSGADINLLDECGQSPLFLASMFGHWISAPELSKHLTTSQCPFSDATNNGDCPCLSHKLISAPELSKHLTTSHSPSRYQFM
jgi:ankyrin repeat protein